MTTDKSKSQQRDTNLHPSHSRLENSPSPQEGQPQFKELDEDSEMPKPQEGDWQDEQRD